MHLHARVPVLILVSQLLTKACRIYVCQKRIPLGRDFPHAYWPHRRPPHPRFYSSLPIALLRPLPTLSPLPAYRLRFPSLLSLLGATDGSCLIRGETQARIPAPGLSLFSCYLFWTKACRVHVMPVISSLSPEPPALQLRMPTPSAPAP